MARRRANVNQGVLPTGTTSTSASLAGGVANDHLVKYSATDHDYGWQPYESFPIGAVYVSVVSTDPSTSLGYGTWVQFGQGRVLIGVDTSDTAYDTVLETGGSATHTHTITLADLPVEDIAEAVSDEDLIMMMAGQ